MSDNKKYDCPSFNYKSTPPPNIRKVRNPFDKALIDRLHKPLCSPGMCKIYKKKSTSSFKWEIDQFCSLVPANIVPCNSQFEPSPDPTMERIAEEATEQYFSQEKVMPSPLETSKKVKPILHTSCDNSTQISSHYKVDTTVFISREVQTILTLPPNLPPELEKLLQPFCTYTQDQNICGEYEITANDSLRRKLFFEEHSDIEHYDSEQTDEEIHVDTRPKSSFDAHSPILYSPDINKDTISSGMKRTFGTPLKKGPLSKSCIRNKILEVVDLGEGCPLSPVGFQTPRRVDSQSGPSSLASVSISPLTKAASSDEEKNNFPSPESDTMAICLNCVSETDSDRKGLCFCKMTPNKIVLTRSMSLKESPPRSRKGLMSEKRSLSMSSLHRSRSVQKLDFSMDMSIDASLHDNSQEETEFPAQNKRATWSMVEDSSIENLVKIESAKFVSSNTQVKTQSLTVLDETPIKGNSKADVRSHQISRIRVAMPLSPLEMSLDNSLESDNPLSLEDKKIDFNSINLKLLTESVSRFDYTTNNVTKVGDDASTSFKRIDSGFNENTFYANASSYYESAIKPSELTVTNVSKNTNALKEISNVNWMRVDSGFKDETSTDSMQFYNPNETQPKKFNNYYYSDLKDKENTEDFDRILVQSNKNDAMSMSEIFTDDMTFNFNFSSTPSKNKSRKVNS